MSIRAFFNEAGAELLKTLRAPEFFWPSLALPVAFYSLFGIALPGSNQRPEYLLATFGVFAVMGPSIFGFGAGVATERVQGWLRIKRAAPVPAIFYLGAKLIAVLVFCNAALILIYGVAGFGAGVSLPRETWMMLWAVHMGSAIPFAFIGLTLGFALSPGGAVAAANIVFLGLAALGGLLVPIFLFPDILKLIASYLPTYHLGEIALSVVDPDGGRSPIGNLTYTAVLTAGFGIAALLSWARQT